MFIDLVGMREYGVTLSNPVHRLGLQNLERYILNGLISDEIPPEVIWDVSLQKKTPDYEHKWYDHFIGASEIRREEEVVTLARIQNNLLIVLERKPNLILSHDELIFNIWGREQDILARNNLRVSVRSLRECFRSLDIPNPIRTRHGFGYGLVDPSKPHYSRRLQTSPWNLQV